MATKKKTVVLVGGCFDVLHPGHVIFLQKAKKLGERLVVLLESDEKIKRIKGVNRPVHNQTERMQILKALKSVDVVIPLPFMENEQEYDDFVQKINPDIIAATQNAPDNHHKIRVAKLIGAKFKYVTKMIGRYSTSSILNRV